MGLVTMDGGRSVNTSGGVIHFTGISWAGQVGKPVEDARAGPREVAFASGACLAVPREVWASVGGFPASFFMYCEDVDLSLRLRLSGGRVGVEPSAVVDHEYDFHKGGAKWRLRRTNDAVRQVGNTGRRQAARIRGSTLTRREREVAHLAAQGHTAREIAEHLSITERTVEGHLSNVYAKLDVASKLELVRTAQELKF